MTESQRILIVGGVAGGASAAARARRLSESAEIILFERGEYISFANCGLPYHIGEVIADREKLLVQTPKAMRRRFNIDVRTRQEVLRIDPAAKKITVRNLNDNSEYEERYDKLILSPGATPIRPEIPGGNDPRIHTLQNIPDMDRIKAIVDRNPNGTAAIIGGGYIGLEMAEELRHRGMEVHLIELLPQVFAAVDAEMSTPLVAELQAHGVQVHLGTTVEKFDPAGGRLKATLQNGKTLSLDLVLMAIGVRPETTLAKLAGLKLGVTGGIAVNAHLQTSDPDIYAVGDVIEVTNFVSGSPAKIPLAGPANRQGRIAADHIFGRDSAYRHTQGTAICKVFNLSIGLTGLTERAAQAAGIRHDKIYVHASNHASYYPGATPITLKLLFDPDNGKILGAQAIGAEGVDKRIDVLAVALRAGLTVFDLEHFELSYAPPYGSAKDVVNYAGFVAGNTLRGDSRLAHVEDFTHPTPDQFLLDVRTPAEFEAGFIPAAVNIPLDDLRNRLDEIPKDREILVYCQAGLRGYLAERILRQRGFEKVRNLTGGYKTYQMFKKVPASTGPSSPSGKSVATAATANSGERPVRVIDACGLQCPGPIMQLKSALEKMAPGETLCLRASDPGFLADAPAWCRSTGHELIKTAPAGKGVYEAWIRKTAGHLSASQVRNDGQKAQTIVVFSGDLDKVMAAFIIANGAASMGVRVTLFFTFWGLNALRRKNPPAVQKTFIEKMFARMMPRGAGKLALSKMDMLGVGRFMMKGIMKKKHVATLEALIGSAKLNGIKLVACAMSMDVMGIHQEELIDGVEIGGVAMYLNEAQAGNVNLFI